MRERLPLTYNGENGVSVFSQSPLIGSLSNLQVTRTGIKSQFGPGRTFHYGVICPWVFPLDFEWGQWYLHLFSITMNSVFIKFTGNGDRHKISDEFKFWSYLTSHFGVTWPWVVKKMYLQLFSVTFHWIFVKLAGNGDRHKSSNEFEFGPHRNVHFGVIRPWAQIFFPIDI